MTSARRETVDAWPTEEVLRLAGNLPASTLEYWINKGLVSPSVRVSVGHRYTRLWTLREVITVRTIRALRSAGCSLQRIRTAVAALESQSEESLSQNVLYWNGTDLLHVGAEGQVESTWTNPGQMVFRTLAALPIGRWRDDCEDCKLTYFAHELEEDGGRGALPVQDESPLLASRRRRRAQRQ